MPGADLPRVRPSASDQVVSYSSSMPDTSYAPTLF